MVPSAHLHVAHKNIAMSLYTLAMPAIEYKYFACIIRISIVPITMIVLIVLASALVSLLLVVPMLFASSLTMVTTLSLSPTS